jgi:4'-phosphopantetheinyl transferase
LLKRHLISQYARVPWADATAIREDAKGKPYFALVDGSEPVAFNISHQDGLVVLVAVVGYKSGKIEVGVDVVSCHERRDRDRQTVLAEGWDAFVDVYESIFGPADVAAMKFHKLPFMLGSVDDQLRLFYTYWCAKEAYIKMTGEALLADWLQKLEFRGLKPPRPVATAGDMEFGEKMGNLIGTDKFDVLMEQGKDEDVRMEIQSLGSGYMLGTSLRTLGRPDDARKLLLPGFRMFSLGEIEIPGGDMAG